MTMPITLLLEDVAFAAYVQLRRQSPDASPTDRLRARIGQTEDEVHRLQEVLGRERELAVQQEQGLLFAWAYLRLAAQRELDALGREPWLQELSLIADGNTLWIAAGLANCCHRLELSICGDATRRVYVHQPALTVDQNTPLFHVVLNSLFAEGRLAGVVAACAQRLGLTLDTQRTNPAPAITPEVSRAYFRQRAAWLTEHGFQAMPQTIDPDLIVAQLDSLYHTLFLLDHQLHGHLRQIEQADPLVRYQTEWQQLVAVPGLRSLSAQATSAEMITEPIAVDGILVGEFRVQFNFTAGNLRITNTTHPIMQGDTRYDHPHVRNGVPCLGNIQKHVKGLLASWNLVYLVPLTLDFLRSYNPSNPHCNLRAWQ